MCSHGFRSSASTILNERHFDPNVIEVALAHQDPNQVRASYNRALYWKERINLMQSWADLLDEFKVGAIARAGGKAFEPVVKRWGEVLGFPVPLTAGTTRVASRTAGDRRLGCMGAPKAQKLGQVITTTELLRLFKRLDPFVFLRGTAGSPCQFSSRTAPAAF
jgi:hypothetical protein